MRRWLNRLWCRWTGHSELINGMFSVPHGDHLVIVRRVYCVCCRGTWLEAVKRVPRAQYPSIKVIQEQSHFDGPLQFKRQELHSL